MTAAKTLHLLDRVMEFISQGPFFFNENLHHFGSEEYRDLLVTWGTIRSREKFERNEDGQYILMKR